jgi:hypothetical protein
MATLTYQEANTSGGAITPVAAAGGGDSVPVHNRGALLVRNGGGSPITVTLVVPGTEYGQARADVPYTVAAGGVALIGPLVTDLAPSDGLVDFTYSGVTSVTVAAVVLDTP